MTGRKLDFVVIGVLSTTLLIFALNEFFWDVETAAEITRTTGRQTIAVLPFVNMSSNSEQDYFSDGISEELLNLLAKIPELRVTSRSSAFFYKGKDIKIADIGRELGVLTFSRAASVALVTQFVLRPNSLMSVTTRTCGPRPGTELLMIFSSSRMKLRKQ